MKPIDWIVMFAWLVAIVGYGLYRGRGSNTVDRYLLAGKSMPWYAMGLSIMATQASAVTFISTTGQSYTDGMRFVQFYFGLPLAMVILSATAVPIFHRANVYTAYEYLEQRFDVKTRALVSAIFLIPRGLAAGLSLYAPAVVLSVILGWPDRWTTMLMGLLIVIYTSIGGNKAVMWADVQQMMLISCALVLALFMAIHLMPADVSWAKAISLAGAAGRLNAVTTHFDWDDRYNLWSGLIGGMFLALAYFGCDQSQVQRYLTGKSIAQSRLGCCSTPWRRSRCSSSSSSSARWCSCSSRSRNRRCCSSRWNWRAWRKIRVSRRWSSATTSLRTAQAGCRRLSPGARSGIAAETLARAIRTPSANWTVRMRRASSWSQRIFTTPTTSFSRS